MRFRNPRPLGVVRDHQGLPEGLPMLYYLNCPHSENKRPVRYMSATFRTKVDQKLKNYFEVDFQNGDIRESI